MQLRSAPVSNEPKLDQARASWRAYGGALAAVLAALVVRYALNPILGNQGPYLILTFAIVLAAFYGGFGPAFFATFLSTAIGTSFVVSSSSPDVVAELLKSANIGRTVLYFLIGTGISVIGGKLRASQLQVAASVSQLRASNRAKDDAVAILAHEIRNPLAALHSAHLLLQHATDQPALVRKAADVIARQVEQMKSMAESLLDLSGITRGEVLLDMQRIDVREVVSQALEQTSQAAAGKAHSLSTDLGEAPAFVLGDRTRLVQVFANLIGNACKYTEPGGELAVAIKTRGDAVEVTVRDTGIGMDPDSIAELFEPFVQARRPSHAATNGLGLGLAIVRKIVQIHGGDVRAASVGPGHGSIFTVRLPPA